ncbi:MAG: chemotaxis protein CheW, partial [Planctomycetales bacterium]|nr:chemotaxis protein CheW [Planctomycetales bacterium]
VVRSNIEKLGGTVDVETQLHVGTTIVVTLPLTLAIIPSLIVESRNQRFAIPQVNIVELVRIRDQEHSERIGHVKNKELLRLRGSLLPLVRLEAALGRRRAYSNSDGSDAGEPQVRNIIVLESGSLCYGVVVDDLFDSEEIVVKPLGRHLKECPCLSGATILGDGQVALILDVAGIAQQTSLRIAEEEQNAEGATDHSDRDSQSTQPVMLFTNHPDEQFAVLMEAVSRIERIRTNQIDSVGGRDLLQYGGGSLTLLRLETLINAKPRVESDRLYVVVFEAAGREIGIVAPELVDIRNVPTELDELTFEDDGVIGSYVIENRTTRLLDTVRLARKSRPDWFRPPEAAIAAATMGKPLFEHDMDSASDDSTTILLAEDSGFFRRQVKGYLEAEGYTVCDYVDGREAWKALAADPTRFSLVLTDIEMPNMDGLELARKIRSEDRFANLPIVALTSLASQEDFQRGYDAGVTGYQVKLDREELMSTVRALMGMAEPIGV